jgi:VCBS repeat-containing protein
MITRTLYVYQVRPLGWGVLENDTDAERDPLSASLVSGPAHGALVFNSDGTFEYTPSEGFYGDDSFTYQASDGFGGSNVGTVKLTVASLPPTATEDSYSVAEDSTLEVAADKGLLANDSDPESQTLTALLDVGPSNGTLTLNEDGSFRYVPRADFFGSDSFTYLASDGTSTSAAAKVNQTVTGTPDAPVGVADSYTTSEDFKFGSVTSVLANDVDPDGDKLTASLLSEPTNGKLEFSADGFFTYLPNANYFGSDQFTYKVSDGTSESQPITVNLTVTSVADTPVATADNYTTDEDKPLSIAAAAGVLANDTSIEGAPLKATLVAAPSNGTLTLAADGSFIYTPRADFHGSDSFRYYNSDVGGKAEAIVSIVVNAVADAPRAKGDSFVVQEDQTLTVPVANGVLKNDSDAEGDALTGALASGPVHGELTFQSDGSFVYKPDANYSGPDSFTYRASGGGMTSDPATVAITVTAVNDAPVAAGDAYQLRGSLSVPAPQGLLSNDQDVDSKTLTPTIVAGPQHGQVTLKADGSFTYAPGSSFLFSDSFTYRISDGIAQSNVATVNLEATLWMTTQNVTVTTREN